VSDMVREADGAPVLIIEDDPDVRDALEQVCEEEGYPFVSAGSGREALERLRKGLAPCLVLLDLVLPGEDGSLIGRWLRDHPRLSSTPVVVISGGSARMPGATEHLPKPFPLEKLVSTIDRFCRRCSA
jgi:two-component system, chemotaxis family, chemotaxis protein CheY